MTQDTKHQSLADRCYERLKEAIIRGEFAPGEKLRIVQLKSRLNIGSTPIREALSRLTFSGLIQTEANRGFFVKHVSEFEVRDIYNTLQKIELLALDRSLDLGDANWEANILASLYKLSLIEKATPQIDGESWLTLNNEFHDALVAACDSPCLLKIRSDVYQLFKRYCRLSFIINKNSLLSNYKDHCDIAKAAIERDKTGLATLISLHLEKSLEHILIRLKKNKII
jgi:GntR family carbon starvation induced transcriptional regulator